MAAPATKQTDRNIKIFKRMGCEGTGTIGRFRRPEQSRPPPYRPLRKSPERAAIAAPDRIGR